MSGALKKEDKPDTSKLAPLKIPPKSLAEKQFKLQSFATNRWAAVIPMGVAYERVFDTNFWAHVARMLRPSDIIEVHSEAGDFYAELYVLEAKRMEASVAELRHVKLERKASETSLISDLTVKNLGPLRKYCIVRSDGQVVSDGFLNEGDALAALGQRAKGPL
jgi:hypothetical protein